MRDYLVQRVKEVATYICGTHDTIRGAAKKFGFSKSTIHNDLSKRLYYVDATLYKQTQDILDEHFAEKHIRGGEATRKKYTVEAESE